MRGSTNILRALLILAALASTGCGIGDAQKKLRTAVDAERPSLDDCFAQALERDREMSGGDMQVLLHVSRKTGRVDQAEVAHSEVEDAALQQCVESALTNVALEEPPKANLKVEYTLRFVPNA